MPEVQLGVGMILLLALASLGPVCLADGPRNDPGSGQIRLLFAGQLVGGVSLFEKWYEIEPRMTVQLVPCSPQQMMIEDAKRLVRLYMPRNYDQLVQSFDCVIAQDLSPSVLSPDFLPDLRKAILEEGLGAVLAEFVFWFGNGNRIDLWMASTFYDIVPADIVFDTEIPRGKNVFYQLVSESRVLDLPGIEAQPMNGGHHGNMIARQGSELLARWRDTDYHAVTFRHSGEGALIQIGHGWDNIPGDTTSGWEYCQDYAYNMVFATTGHEIPEDLVLVRRARSLLTSSIDSRSLVFAILEFAEMFGANTRPISDEVAEIDKSRVDGQEYYLQGDYSAAAAAFEEIVKRYQEVELEALGLKDRALLWVYLIEWLSVSGTCIISGLVLYSLMVRRKMYRSVESTKTASTRRSM